MTPVTSEWLLRLIRRRFLVLATSAAVADYLTAVVFLLALCQAGRIAIAGGPAETKVLHACTPTTRSARPRAEKRGENEQRCKDS